MHYPNGSAGCGAHEVSIAMAKRATIFTKASTLDWWCFRGAGPRFLRAGACGVWLLQADLPLRARDDFKPLPTALWWSASCKLPTVYAGTSAKILMSLTIICVPSLSIRDPSPASGICNDDSKHQSLRINVNGGDGRLFFAIWRVLPRI